MKNYQVLEHTADIGIRVKSLSLAGLFKNAGLALTELSAEKQKNQYPEKHKIVIMQKADNVEELFVNWLNELLSVSAAEALIFADIKINQINEQFVDAIAIGTDSRNYKTNVEIKAATYHQLKVQKTGFYWQAEVIFDV
ncbi:MAG: archease [Candidatus Omnitrophota bacterium]|nr:archease [Candidatus Omnitrophota bacterium]